MPINACKAPPFLWLLSRASWSRSPYCCNYPAFPLDQLKSIRNLDSSLHLLHHLFLETVAALLLPRLYLAAVFIWMTLTIVCVYVCMYVQKKVSSWRVYFHQGGRYMNWTLEVTKDFKKMEFENRKSTKKVSYNNHQWNKIFLGDNKCGNVSHKFLSSNPHKVL